MDELVVHDLQRAAATGGYTGAREYELENRQFSKQARVTVNVACDPDGPIHLQFVSKDGWNSGVSSLRQAMDAEMQTSRPPIRAKALVTKDNYTFRMIGTAPLNGRTAYVIQVIPKREEIYLFNGRVWIDAEDFAMARMEGRLTKTPSFWVRYIDFAVEFRKNGDSWFPSLATSTSQVRIFGPTEVDVHFSDYSPRLLSANRHGSSSMMEANYGGH